MATATTSNSKVNPKSDISTADIEQSLAQVKNDIAGLTETLALYGKVQAGAVSEAASQKSKDVIETSEVAIEELKAKIEVMGEDVSAHVQKKPLQTLVLAAGIGAALALLIKR